MAAITDLSDVTNLFTGGGAVAPVQTWICKIPRVGAGGAAATIAGQFTSLWRYASIPGVTGGTPGAVAACDATTQGAIPWTNPGGGRSAWLMCPNFSPTQNGTLMLYDRLLHCGGLSGTVTTAQTVGGTITRNTGGTGNFIAIEIDTQIGATSTTITANYTNQAGTSGKTTTAVTFGATNNREAQRWIFLPLADGDTGVQSVQSVTVAATTGTAGSFAVVVGKMYLQMGSLQATAVSDSLLLRGGPIQCGSDHCFALLWLAAGTSAPTILQCLSVVEK